MKVLLICHKIPFPLNDGGSFSMYSSATGLLGQGLDLNIYAVNTPKYWVDPANIPVAFKEKAKLEYTLVDTRINTVKLLFNLFSKKSYLVERFNSGLFENGLIQVLNRDNFDIIQLEHSYMCLYIEAIRQHSGAKIILRPQNAENQVWESLLKGKVSFFKRKYLQEQQRRLLDFEKKMSGKVDGIIAISPGDEAIFKSYTHVTPVIQVPIGIDFQSLSGYDFNTQYINFPVFYHLGSMDWEPNIQGINWFIEEVIPYIKTVCPEFVFRIAGKKMPGSFYSKQDKNLIVDGEVSDALRYHEDKAVLIVPLLSGGGIRAKIIEAMALGKIIISTTKGAEGIPFSNQENILIADTPEEFAVQILKCIHSIDFCRFIGNNALQLARERYDSRTTSAAMINFYNTLF